MTLRLGILASGNGSNMRSVVAACRDGRLDAVPAIVISNNSSSGAITWAAAEGISTAHLSSATHPEEASLDEAIRDALQEHAVDLVLLLGYMRLLGPRTLAAYRDRVVNIHPGPLPRFGGQGMYGQRVHQAVLDAGVPETAVTIHLVDEVYDRGRILAVSPVPVLPGDDVTTLAGRVLEEEHRFLVATLERIARGEITIGLPSAP